MVSIIVPVHNVENYLTTCINSLLSQTWGEYEIIIINDGSTDSSTSICNYYANNFSNINVIHQSCKGVSFTRNKGIELAKGEFITFVDSDDWVSSDYLEELMHPIINHHLDFIISGMIDIYDWPSNNITHRLPDSGILRFTEAKDYYQIMTTELMTSPVAKIYRKSIIEKYNIKFNSTLSFAEDKEFNIMYMRYAQKGCSIPYVGYNYRRNTINSLTKKEHQGVFNTYCRQWLILKDNFYTKGFTSIPFIDQMLVNELFNIINDYIYQTAINNKPIESSTHINFVFLRQHKNKIKDCWWKKLLISYNLFGVLNTIYKIRFKL